MHDDVKAYMGGYQKYGPFLGTLNICCHIIIRIQKGTIILTTTHITFIKALRFRYSDTKVVGEIIGKHSGIVTCSGLDIIGILCIFEI